MKGVLGKIPSHNTRAPRTLLHLNSTKSEQSQDSSLLLQIENAFDCLIDIEDIDHLLRNSNSYSEETILNFTTKRREIVRSLLFLFLLFLSFPPLYLHLSSFSLPLPFLPSFSLALPSPYLQRSHLFPLPSPFSYSYSTLPICPLSSLSAFFFLSLSSPFPLLPSPFMPFYGVYDSLRTCFC